jgi:hypothetical protein
LPCQEVDEAVTVDIGSLRAFGWPDWHLAVGIKFIERNRYARASRDIGELQRAGGGVVS